MNPYMAVNYIIYAGEAVESSWVIN
jgi:hypothetical protein